MSGIVRLAGSLELISVVASQYVFPMALNVVAMASQLLGVLSPSSPKNLDPQN